MLWNPLKPSVTPIRLQSDREDTLRKPPNFFVLLWSNRKARIGITMLFFFFAMAVFGPLVAPYSLSDTDFATSQPPTLAHWLGTTQSGQDVLTQLLYGARVSLFVGFVAGALVIVIAMFIGFVAGYFRGWVDDLLSLLMNIVLVLPGLPLMILIAAYIPSHGIGEIILVMSITGWAFGGRTLRAQMFTMVQQDYVIAAKFAGEKSLWIIFREIVPNMLSYIIANFFGAVIGAVLAEAGLEFLGLGNPSITSWGTMIYWAQSSDAMLSGQWAWILAPGLCIAGLAASLTFINFGIDAVANPRLQEE
ncbi:ABC transporter permease [Sulfoacidibacillus thermotolerans]|uniref:Peptide ABC transporter permease n=1 Tax=Sulfoacidibacillus thermotolerans TaxID=1765684 RepID=A0A2U3DA65_SULT2|nr:ABC transporter permease [Sulfoacidibacillus thermotolerans]PWI58153.1 peptide ABC transporter permease [Sulfoacidibacillus thermotolerans]